MTIFAGANSIAWLLAPRTRIANWRSADWNTRSSQVGYQADFRFSTANADRKLV